MAFNDVIDDTTPADDEERHLGDDRIRELKRALNERLASFLANWPDVDPLVLKATAVPNDFIVAAMIGAAQVGTAELADLNVTTGKLADGAVTSVKIADLTIQSGDLADDAVLTAKIIDEAVTEDKIGTGAVTSLKIADENVTAQQIAPDAVTTVKILDGAVTSAKLGALAIGNGLLTDQSHLGLFLEFTDVIPVSAGDGFGSSSRNAPGSNFDGTKDIFIFRILSIAGGVGSIQGWVACGQPFDANNYYMSVGNLLGAVAGGAGSVTVKTMIYRKLSDL